MHLSPRTCKQYDFIEWGEWVIVRILPKKKNYVHVLSYCLDTKWKLKNYLFLSFAFELYLLCLVVPPSPLLLL